MRKRIYFYLSAVILIALISSCTPSQRMARLIKKHPELVDTTTRTVLKELVDSAKVNRPELSKTELDSLLKDYCNDTVINNVVYRDRIKERIINRCQEPRKETVFLENGKLFITRDSGGTEYKLETIKETVYQDRIVYLDKKQEIFKWIAMGALGMLLVILLIIALVKWGFR